MNLAKHHLAWRLINAEGSGDLFPRGDERVHPSVFIGSAKRELNLHTVLECDRPSNVVLAPDLKAKRIVTCAEAMSERDGRWLWTAGLVLVR